jgi:hypothetical protein
MITFFTTDKPLTGLDAATQCNTPACSDRWLYATPDVPHRIRPDGDPARSLPQYFSAPLVRISQSVAGVDPRTDALETVGKAGSYGKG